MTTATRLYELSDAYRALVETADDDPEADLPWLLGQVEGAIQTKVDSIVALARERELLADVRREEARRLVARADADEKLGQKLRAYVLEQMRAMGIDRVDAPRFTVTIRQNPIAVSIVDEDAVPQEYVELRTTRHIDKRKIATHIKATGEVVSGTEATRSERLDIR